MESQHNARYRTPPSPSPNHPAPRHSADLARYHAYRPRTEAWGHAIAQLFAELPTPAPQELVEQGRVLDNFYVPTRYPNSHPSGAPFEHYGPLQSDQAIQYARQILEFVRSQMA